MHSASVVDVLALLAVLAPFLPTFSVKEQVHPFLSSSMPLFRVSVISLIFAQWPPEKRHHPSPLPILPCSPCLREPLPLRCSSCCHAAVFAVTCWNWVRSCNPKSVVSRRIPRHRFATSCLRRAQFAFPRFNTPWVFPKVSVCMVWQQPLTSARFQTVIVFVSQPPTQVVRNHLVQRAAHLRHSRSTAPTAPRTDQEPGLRDIQTSIAPSPLYTSCSPFFLPLRISGHPTSLQPQRKPPLLAFHRMVTSLHAAKTTDFPSPYSDCSHTSAYLGNLSGSPAEQVDSPSPCNSTCSQATHLAQWPSKYHNADGLSSVLQCFSHAALSSGTWSADHRSRTVTRVKPIACRPQPQLLL